MVQKRCHCHISMYCYIITRCHVNIAHTLGLLCHASDLLVLVCHIIAVLLCSWSQAMHKLCKMHIKHTLGVQTHMVHLHVKYSLVTYPLP